MSCAAHCSIDQQSPGSVDVVVPAFAPYFLSAWYAIEPLALRRADRSMSLAVDTGPPASAPPIYLSQLALLN